MYDVIQSSIWLALPGWIWSLSCFASSSCRRFRSSTSALKEPTSCGRPSLRECSSRSSTILSEKLRKGLSGCSIRLHVSLSVETVNPVIDHIDQSTYVRFSSATQRRLCCNKTPSANSISTRTSQTSEGEPTPQLPQARIRL